MFENTIRASLTKKNAIFNIKQVLSMLLSMLPRTKVELFLFFGLVLIYSSYSFFILFNSCILDYPEWAVDLFFSYDSLVYYYEMPFNLEAHPLFAIILAPILGLGDIMQHLILYKGKAIFVVLSCSIMIALSVIYVNRYLSTILKLPRLPLFLLTALFCFCGTNLVLAFTIESYTLTSMLLTFTVQYYSEHIQKDKPVSFLPNLLLATGLGGITVTNYAKGILPIFFGERKWKKAMWKSIIITLIFGFIALLVWYNASLNVYGSYIFRITTFTNYHGVYEMILDRFLGSPLLMAKILIKPNGKLPMIWMDYYHHWWQYLCIITIFAAILYSFLINSRQKLVQLLGLLFTCDLFIHLVCKYGLGDAYIFGAHWIYIVPLMLGWLYVKLNKTEQKIFNIVLTAILVVICLNNANILVDFYTLAKEYFPLSASNNL